MNDMRDLENGFKREPLGVGVGDWLPEDLEAAVEAERRWPRARPSSPVGWLNEGMASGFVIGAAWQRTRP